MHRCFPVNFVKFLRTPFLQNTSARLLLQLGFRKCYLYSTVLLQSDHLMINKWIIMRYLEYLLLTYGRYLMYLSWLFVMTSFCETECLQLVTFCLKMIQDYLQNRKQRTKIGSSSVFGRILLIRLNIRTSFDQCLHMWFFPWIWK